MKRDPLILLLVAVGLGFVSCSGETTARRAVSGVTIVPPASTLLPMRTALTLVAVVNDASGSVLADRQVTWTSSNASVATVVSTGIAGSSVSPVAPGVVTITATSEGKSGTLALTVAPPPVARLTIIPPASSVIFVGDDISLVAVTRDDRDSLLTDRAVTWTSSAPGVATVLYAVGNPAVVRASSVGSATITATAETKQASVTFSVIPAPVASISITSSSYIIGLGYLATATAVLRDARGNVLSDRTVTWTSSNTDVATVQSASLTTVRITAVGPGTAVITGTAEGKSATTTVTVPIPPPQQHAFLWSAGAGMVDLGVLPLPGYYGSQAQAINATAQVVGSSFGPLVATRAFIWSAATGMRDLGPLAGYTSSSAAGINSTAQVAGYSSNASGYPRAVLWSVIGAVRDLGTLPGHIGSFAAAINDLGEVLGTSFPATGASHAFLWTDAGGMQDLGPGTGYGIALNSALAVGADNSSPFRWSPQQGIQTMPILSGDNFGVASGINNAGVSAGTSAYDEYYGPYIPHAVLWTAARELVNLSVLPGFNTNDSEAYAINDVGQVAGRSGLHAFVWSQAVGFRDLGVLPERDHSTARGINGAGQIVGSSWRSGSGLAVVRTDLSRATKVAPGRTRTP